MLGKEQYDELIKRVAAAEKRHGAYFGQRLSSVFDHGFDYLIGTPSGVWHAGGDDDAELAAAGLQCRACPKCSTRIEKNQGCNEMDCYICGHHFTWQKAQKIDPIVAVRTGAKRNGGAGGRAGGGSNRRTARHTTQVARPFAAAGGGGGLGQAAATEPGTIGAAAERAPADWVIARLGTPPMSEPTFTPRDAARAQELHRLAEPHRERGELRRYTAAGTRWPAPWQHSSGEGAATPRDPSDDDDDDKLPTAAAAVVAPAVVDATLAAQARLHRRPEHRVYLAYDDARGQEQEQALQLQAQAQAKHLRAVAAARTAKQRRMRKLYEPN